MKPKPFGHFKPDDSLLNLIQKCRHLPNSWWGKQKAQWMRKSIMKSAKLPMDLVLEGAAIRCFLTDNISERGFVFMPWRFDQQERTFLLNHLPKDGVFVDVGANVGIYSCLALSVLKEKGHVVAIEPNPPVAKRLAFNLESTSIHHKSEAKITIIDHGVSDQSGEFSLYLNQNNLGASSLKASRGEKITIQCFPLLDTLKAQKLKHIDAMKVDIEGAEDLALVPFIENAPEGMLPSVLIFEDNRPHWQLNVIETLASRGYRLVQLTRMNYIFTRD